MHQESKWFCPTKKLTKKPRLKLCEDLRIAAEAQSLVSSDGCFADGIKTQLTAV